jgi:hypothetical protein
MLIVLRSINPGLAYAPYVIFAVFLFNFVKCRTSEQLDEWKNSLYFFLL